MNESTGAKQIKKELQAIIHRCIKVYQHFSNSKISSIEAKFYEENNTSKMIMTIKTDT